VKANRPSPFDVVSGLELSFSRVNLTTAPTMFAPVWSTIFPLMLPVGSSCWLGSGAVAEPRVCGEPASGPAALSGSGNCCEWAGNTRTNAARASKNNVPAPNTRVLEIGLISRTYLSLLGRCTLDARGRPSDAWRVKILFATYVTPSGLVGGSFFDAVFRRAEPVWDLDSS
jgi:hypothetical protein